MATQLMKYRLFLLVAAVDVTLALWRPALAGHSATNAFSFLAEVLMILPPVMVLIGLLDAWVPRVLVEAHLGRGAGLRGAIFAILLGTAAAGPIYAAFPIALSLRNKGARLANMVIFLGTWASIKIPMLLMEGSFIGLRFALLRLAFTVPCVLGAGYLMEMIMPEDAVLDAAEPGLREETAV
ncbi:permease [Geomonas sp. Red276]